MRIGRSLLPRRARSAAPRAGAVPDFWPGAARARRRARWLRLLRFVVGLAFLAALAWVAWQQGAPAVTRFDAKRPVTAIDGDSIKIAAGKTADGTLADAFEIRLYGLDAVEYRQLCGDRAGVAWPCGREARAALAARLKGGALTCTFSATDRFGRRIGECGTDAVPDLAQAQVREGWAVASTNRGDPGPYADDEAAARAARRGIWRGDFTPPDQWRAARQAPSLLVADD